MSAKLCFLHFLYTLTITAQTQSKYSIYNIFPQVKKWIAAWDIGTIKIQNIYRALHDVLIAARLR